MTVLRGSEIRDYTDARGNRIVGIPKVNSKSLIEFKGSNCTVIFGQNVHLHGAVVFHRDNSTFSMDDNGWLRGRATLGLGCSIGMGKDFISGASIYLTAAEETSITFGDGVLMAKSCDVRADDSHPIYDGISGERINASRSISVGDHVWIGQEVILMPGARIGTGSMVGARSIVTASRPIPENVIVAGSPITVLRTGIVWVNKHLQMDEDVPLEIDPVFETETVDPAQVNVRVNLFARFSRASRAFVENF